MQNPPGGAARFFFFYRGSFTFFSKGLSRAAFNQGFHLEIERKGGDKRKFFAFITFSLGGGKLATHPAKSWPTKYPSPQRPCFHQSNQRKYLSAGCLLFFFHLKLIIIKKPFFYFFLSSFSFC